MSAIGLLHPDWARNGVCGGQRDPELAHAHDRPISLFRLPDWAILILWFGMQVLTGLPQLMMLDPKISGGVAVWAHVGGFVAGFLLIRNFHDPQLLRRRTAGGDAKVVWR